MIGNFRGYAEERHPPPSQFFVFMGQLKLHVMTHGPSLKVGNCLNPLISLATSFKPFLTNLQQSQEKTCKNPRIHPGKTSEFIFSKGIHERILHYNFCLTILWHSTINFCTFLTLSSVFTTFFQNLKLKKIQTAFNIVFKSFNPFSGPNWIFLRRKTHLEVKKSSDCSKLRPESRKNSLGACSGDPMLLTQVFKRVVLGIF